MKNNDCWSLYEKSCISGLRGTLGSVYSHLRTAIRRKNQQMCLRSEICVPIFGSDPVPKNIGLMHQYNREKNPTLYRIPRTHPSPSSIDRCGFMSNCENIYISCSWRHSATFTAKQLAKACPSQNYRRKRSDMDMKFRFAKSMWSVPLQ